ncbi:SpoIIE family protein phosphatase [Candidatus Sumerlaeota bacterium]|nr:SpoIIE family protein phosphatase [Candidatus Sumerlaeota bacterium]
MSQRSYLRVISGPQGGMTFPLIGEFIMLGREPRLGIKIADPMVSRHHAVLSFDQDAAILEDIGSTNGTFLNGAPVEMEIVLQSGDEIRMGSTRMIYVAPEEEPGALSTNHLPHTRVDVQVPLPGTLPQLRPELLDRQQIMTLLRWSTRLHEIESELALAEELASISIQVTRAERAVVLLRRPGETVNLVAVASRSRLSGKRPVLPISRALMRRAVATAQVVHSLGPGDDPVEGDPFLERSDPVRDQLGAVICAPMIYQDTVWGGIHLDATVETRALSREDALMAGNLGHQTAAALAALDMRNRLREQERTEREMSIARDLQESQLPKELPPLPGDWSWAVLAKPARMVGGDYHDAWQTNDGRWAVALGDVSGKGVPAALMLSAMRAYLHAEASRGGVQASSVITQLNQWAAAESPRHMFMSMLFGLLDTRTGEFSHTNAGHPPPLLVTAGEKTRRLECGGLILGVQGGEIYEQETLTLQPGQMLVMFSDGVTDVFNPNREVFGEEGLIELIEASRDQTPEMICRRIWEATRSFLGESEPPDDFTVLIIRAGEKTAEA